MSERPAGSAGGRGSGPGRAPGAVLRDFLHLESAPGLILMATAALALVVANSPLAGLYARLLEIPLGFEIGGFGVSKPSLLWVNDGLMAVFFLVVGMELKREMLVGHLSSWRQASLPAFAALGGMLAPAACYVALNRGDAEAMTGWAIPTATDIAFALGVLSLLGERVPAALKAFLLSVAIFDDLGAIVVIALFYSAGLSGLALGVAAALVLVLWALHRAGVTRPAAYLAVGAPLWLAVLKSGVHATLAGVVVAMFIPLRAGGREGDSPLRRLEHALHPWVSFGILPVFAFFNAGVPVAGLSLRDAVHPVPLGIASGLFLGKQLGVAGLCALAVRLGVAALPAGVRWGQIYGAAVLCGIGFTMSLFIASLAFEAGATSFADLDRLGIVAGSLVSGVTGYLLLRRLPATREPAVGREPG